MIDAARKFAPDRALQEDRPLATDPQRAARQEPGVGVIEAQAARVGVDVAERSVSR